MDNVGGATTLSQDAKRKWKETFLADKFAILLCRRRDAFYVGGNFPREIQVHGFHILKWILCWLWPSLFQLACLRLGAHFIYYFFW